MAVNRAPTALVLDNLEDLTEAATREWVDFLVRLAPRRGSVALLTPRLAEKHPLTELPETARLSLMEWGHP